MPATGASRTHYIAGVGQDLPARALTSRLRLPNRHGDRPPLARVRHEVLWRHLDGVFTPGSRVLELNAAPVATDTDPSSLDALTARFGSWEPLVEVRLLGETELSTLDERFDAVLASAGALNYADCLGSLGARLADVVRPGGTAVAVVMGPTVPWEWCWYLANGRARSALRRLRRNGAWPGIAVRYPSIATARRVFEPAFTVRFAAPVGVVLPPAYVEPFMAEHPRLLRFLVALERSIAGFRPLARVADQYVLVLERR
jgi:SAM-dependent methyltransferase